jgi:hypothetical protein
VTAIADLLRPADRERLLGRVRELDELAGLMRQPGGLAQVPEPVPLCRTGREEDR